MREYRKLNEKTAELYLTFLKKALEADPGEMMTDCFDEEAIRQRLLDPFYQNTASILAVEDGEAVGRIEYHFYGCLQDGYRMAYVDWVYVLPEHRHRGVAQGLFTAFEKECAVFGIDQYYLIRAEGGNADSFYAAFSDAERTREPILRKYFRKDQIHKA